MSIYIISNNETIQLEKLFLATAQSLVNRHKFNYLFEMIYHIDCSDTITQYLKISVIVEHAKNGMIFHLPFWRPGRYEASNYARNVRDFGITDTNGRPVTYKKKNHSAWEIFTDGDDRDIIITYSYYSAELNAGSTVIEEDLVYINFINCLLYNQERITEECSIYINIPDHYQWATSLESPEKGKWTARNYYELADSPFLSAPELTHIRYTAEGIPFHLWIYGETELDAEKLIDHFRKFSEEQIRTMHQFPEKDYHFLIITTPYKLYHGVEHAASTVVCLGPSQELHTTLYDELLGISSHELFHAWNILKIRPKPLLPYHFNKIPVFDTGFVAEGFTTYLGDLFLVRSGVKSIEWYLSELGKLLKRHYENFGRLHTSVAESSIDLWLDGYQAGAPHRKSSIYVEGAVIGLMLDLQIRNATDQKESLLSLMNILYHEYARKNRGYEASDIQKIAQKLSGLDLENFFQSYVFGTENTRPLIDKLLVHYGLEISEKENANSMEAILGVKLSEQGDKWKVIKTAPGSPAEGVLRPSDFITSINGKTPESFESNMGNGKIFDMIRQRNDKKQPLNLRGTADRYFPQYEVQITEGNVSASQNWLKNGS